MSAQLKQALAVILATGVVAFGLLMAAVVVGQQADAQTVPTVQLDPVIGVPIEFLGKPGETHTVTLSCGPGEFAISGGWSSSGVNGGAAPSFVVLDNFASQLPGGGLTGQWTFTFRKLDRGPLLITPSVNCLAGISQIPS